MSDLTPNHNPGEPLQPIDKEGLAKLAQKNIDNSEGGRKTSPPACGSPRSASGPRARGGTGCGQIGRAHV